MTEKLCQKCDGMGMRVATDANGKSVAEACECQHERRIYQLHRRARIPQRYQGCTLDGYRYGLDPDADPSLWNAFNMARGFVNGYPATTNGNGILFTGNIGTGKLILPWPSCKRSCARRACRRCSAIIVSC